MSLVLSFEALEIVGFRMPQLEHLQGGEIRARVFAEQVGPDLALESAEAQIETVMTRCKAHLTPETMIADLLLDQRVASGLGNVFKSELLFIARMAPQTLAISLGTDRIEALYRSGASYLRRNIGPGPRRTRFTPDTDGPLWVYGRHRQACLECGTLIRYARLGIHQRSTYWCPQCQQ